MVHGGCWTTSIADRTLMNYLAGDLRGRGYAVWNIDYRGVDRPGGGYPGTFRDAAAAADLLRTAARAYPLALGRIVVVGHSAGGHLALWLAARPRLPAASPLRTGVPLRIRNVISLGGLPDLEQAAAPPGSGCGTEVVDKLVGSPTISNRDVYADTSIPRLAPLGVRQWLVNGDADRIIPNAFAIDYAAKMRRAGDDVSVEFIPATGHVELVAPGSKAWLRTLGLIAEATRQPRR
jgi:acetyl esterase/lipase